MPQFSSDEVTNFMVMEALVAKAARETREAEKTNKRQAWMKGHKDWAKEQGLV
jgi:hypothetical protein